MDPTIFSTLAASLQIEISVLSPVIKFIYQPRYYENLFHSYNSYVQNLKPRASYYNNMSIEAEQSASR